MPYYMSLTLTKTRHSPTVLPLLLWKYRSKIHKVMTFLLSFLCPQSTSLVLAILILVQLRRKLNVPPVYYSAEAKAGNYSSLGENGDIEWCHQTNWFSSWTRCRQIQRKHWSIRLVNRSMTECTGDVLIHILLSGARNDNVDCLLWISCLAWFIWSIIRIRV